MKRKRIAYWITTALVAIVMAVSGVLSLMRMMPFAHLGYPGYFAYILGVAKLLGVCVLLAPGLVIVKEWAYAGFGITLISACISHLASGDGLKSLDPVFFLAMLVVSYLTRPARRRVLPVAMESAWQPEVRGLAVRDEAGVNQLETSLTSGAKALASNQRSRRG